MKNLTQTRDKIDEQGLSGSGYHLMELQAQFWRGEAP